MNVEKQMKPSNSKRQKNRRKVQLKKQFVLYTIFLVLQVLLIVYFAYLHGNIFSQQELLYRKITVNEKQLERNYTLPLGRGRGSYLSFVITADESRYVFPDVVLSDNNYSARELDAAIQFGDVLTVVCANTENDGSYKVYAAHSETKQYRSLDYWKNESVWFWCYFIVYEVLLLVAFFLVWFLFISKGNPFKKNK